MSTNDQKTRKRFGKEVADSCTRTIVRKYGLLPPVDGVTDLFEQIRAAHEDRKLLTMSTNGARWARRQIETPEIRALADEQSSLSEQIETMVAKISLARRKRAAGAVAVGETRPPRAPVPPELAAELKELRAKKKVVSAKLRALRTEARQSAADVIAEAYERKKVLDKSISENSIVHWGTKAIVRDAVARSDKDRPLYDLDGNPDDVFCPRFDGSGSVSFQVQNQSDGSSKHPITVPQLVRHNDYVYIDSEPTWRRVNRNGTSTNRAGNPYRALPLLHLRIGSKGVGNREPIMATWPIVLHRPIPSGSEIKQVTVTCRRIGPRYVWSCQVTIRVPEDWQSEMHSGTGSVAVVFGARRDGSDIIVAEWLSDTGEAGVLRLKDGGRYPLEDRLTRADGIRSARDQRFDSAKRELATDLAALTVPEWLRNEVRHMHSWKSQRKLARLVQIWERHEWRDGDDAFAKLQAWAKNDRHLWEYESSSRAKAERARESLYRNFAAELTRRFGEVVVSNENMASRMRKPAAESDRGAIADVQGMRFLTAVGSLREAIRNAAQMRRVKLTEIEHSGLLNTCPKCGNSEQGQSNGYFSCLECGHVDDEKRAVLLNMLVRAGFSDSAEAMVYRGEKIKKALMSVQGGLHV